MERRASFKAELVRKSSLSSIMSEIDSLPEELSETDEVSKCHTWPTGCGALRRLDTQKRDNSICEFPRVCMRW